MLGYTSAKKNYPATKAILRSMFLLGLKPKLLMSLLNVFGNGHKELIIFPILLQGSLV